MKKQFLTLLLFTVPSTLLFSQLNMDSLASFLVEAKIETYANEDETRVVDCEIGCKETSFSKNKFKYRDRYFGEYNFSGEELVWWKGKPVWSMNYLGITITSQKIPDDFPSFLKKALRQVNAKYPYRGPRSFIENDFEYKNMIMGSIKEFSGMEKVYYKGIEIYHLNYHGGQIIY